MKVAVIGISGNPSMAKFSHNAGWTRVILSQLKSRFGCNSQVDIVKDANAIHAYDVVVINEGLNYKKGSWNFFGGMQEHTKEKLYELSRFQGEVYCFNEEICWDSLYKRKELQGFHINKKALPFVHCINTDYGPKRIYGDSHSVSIHRDGYGISRNDGKTLFGALRDGGLIESINTDGISHIELYFGNIDVRFHLFRQPSVVEACDRLTYHYLKAVKKLKEKKNGDLHIVIQGLLPIEDESRKIPGTGKYKGENFFGDRKERQAVVNYLNQQWERLAPLYGAEFRPWTGLPEDGFESPKFSAMEARQSVHLRPEYYLFRDGKDEGYGGLF